MIVMSQNRPVAKDRLEVRSEPEVSRRARMEVAALPGRVS
jgi:uncharacterized membrane protein